MITSIASRLARLEAIKPSHIRIIFKELDGHIAEVSVDDCVKNGLDPFAAMKIRGNNLEEAARLLDYMAGENCVIE